MFDLLEARVNQAAMKKLANALARIGGLDVPVIFDAEYKVGMVGVVGMGASQPQLVISNSDVPPGFLDSQIQVGGRSWTVVEPQPDSELPTGLTVVLLERA
jgi:hypothetical protein